MLRTQFQLDVHSILGSVNFRFLLSLPTLAASKSETFFLTAGEKIIQKRISWSAAAAAAAIGIQSEFS